MRIQGPQARKVPRWLAGSIGVLAAISASLGTYQIINGGRHVQPSYVIPEATWSSYVVPTGPVAVSTPATEDGNGWDCRAQGFHDCVIAGERWLNLDHLPVDPYLRFLIVWNAMGIDDLGDGVTYDAVSICQPLLNQRG